MIASTHNVYTKPNAQILPNCLLCDAFILVSIGNRLSLNCVPSSILGLTLFY